MYNVTYCTTVCADLDYSSNEAHPFSMADLKQLQVREQ